MLLEMLESDISIPSCFNQVSFLCQSAKKSTSNNQGYYFTISLELIHPSQCRCSAYCVLFTFPQAEPCTKALLVLMTERLLASLNHPDGERERSSRAYYLLSPVDLSPLFVMILVYCLVSAAVASK